MARGKNTNQPNKDMTVQQAGKKGGKTTSQRYGPEFYEAIGKKGGQKVHDLVEKGKRGSDHNESA